MKNVSNVMLICESKKFLMQEEFNFYGKQIYYRNAISTLARTLVGEIEFTMLH